MNVHEESHAGEVANRGINRHVDDDIAVDIKAQERGRSGSVLVCLGCEKNRFSCTVSTGWDR